MHVKTYPLLALLILCVCWCPAQRNGVQKQAAAAAYDNAEKDALAYVKALAVKTLDSTLPSQGLEDWLRSGPPHVDTLRWMLDDTCDIHPDSEHDYPRCVRIAFKRGGQSGYFLVLIGTLKKGIIGPPRLYYEGIGVQEEGFVQTGWAESLSGLPHLLGQPLISTPVTDLYRQVAARHPIGIPTGADKTALWPFLSRRLTQQLETAQACQDDYFRQHPNAEVEPRPAWLNSGIFVGDGKRVAPLFINPGAREAQKDGSYRVSMEAYERNNPGKHGYIIAGGIPARYFASNEEWPIVATVVRENDRFAVDDVRVFEGDVPDGPSRLLIESFAGCDGVHWTGERAESKPPAALPPLHYTDWNAVNALRTAAYQEEVAFAKALDVHQLDPSLPAQRLEDWLKSAALHVSHVEWNAGRCNIKEGQSGATREPEGRLCAVVWFQRGNARARISVSTPVKGNLGPPKVTSIGVRDRDDGLLTPIPADGNMEKPPDSDRLSDLTRLLDEEGAIDVTRNLYDAVVAHHPLGIPQGQGWAGISPLLSKRLRGQLETAQACQADYLRQRPRPAEAPKPAWFNTGIFSGDGALALPGADLVDHKERQGDGSFQVFVWLSRQNAAAQGAAPTASQWKTWHVSALVKSESGRFVVDDIRLFGDGSIEGPSRLLSDSITGCEGPRWVGIGSTSR